MEIKASYFAAFFVLLYFGIGIFIVYFFRKRLAGRFGGQGYKFPAVIYFISVPIIVAIGTDFFNKYDGDAIYNLSLSLDSQFTISIFIFAIIPTIIYLGIGIYILSLEHIKGKKGYKGPAIIYFISVPTLILIAITIQFMMNYTTGRFETNNKPVGYEIYKFLVLQDIIPRSGLTLDDKSNQQDLTIAQSNTIKPKQTIKLNENFLEDKNKDYDDIVRDLKIDEYFSITLDKQDKESEDITVEIKKKISKKKLNNGENINTTINSITYLVDNGFYVKTNNINYPSYITYSYSKGLNSSMYIENIPKDFKSYSDNNNSKHLFVKSDDNPNSVLLLGLNKSIKNLEIEFKKFAEYLKDKVENNEITNKEAKKIAIDKFTKEYLNYFSFTDYNLKYNLTPEEKENFNIIGKYPEIVNYDPNRSTKFLGLCKTPEKYNNFFKNNYKDKNCEEIYLKKINKIEIEFVNTIENLQIRLEAKLNEPILKPFKTDEKYYALVIGNNNYEHLEKLDAAENDAVVIADVLKNKYGFEVDLLLNADQETTVDTLFSITDKLKNNENLLIYYAGHGELDKAENRGYWLPVDASFEKRSKWISNQTIVDRIKATKAKHVLLVADSCFSGTLMRSGTNLQNQEPIDEKYIERLKNKKTRLVITSGGNEPVVDSVGGDHSLFALKFIDTLKNSENVINSQILFENIRRYVVANADQTPERAQVHKTGHDGGDFLFFPKN